MTKIQIIKKQDGYAYKYYMMDKDNRPFYVTKSGFTTPEKALEIAKKSYAYRIKRIEESQSIHKNEPKPTEKKPIKQKGVKKKEPKPVEKVIEETTTIKPVIEKPVKKVTEETTIVKPQPVKPKPTKKRKENKVVNYIKNLDITANGYKLLETLVFGTIAVVVTCGAIKVYNDMQDKLPPLQNSKVEEEENNNKELITIDNCDFSNLHIMLRTEKETNEVCAVTSDMLTKLGVSNEIIFEDIDLSTKVYRTAKNNPNTNVVLINLESGYEDKNSTTIMGDCSNKRMYSSDLLAASINEALNEYNLNSTVKSGQKGDIWRKQTDVEEELSNAGVINTISQLTIDLPTIVGEDELTRNDAAASIVEGIMRWTTIDKKDRYKEYYYTTQYSDTLITLLQENGYSMKYLEENSDIDMTKGVKVGNTILVESLPKVITNTTVINPCTTTDKSEIKPATAIYVVQYGDTVTKIANTYGMRVEDLSVPSGDIDDIRPGDIVYVNTYNLYETHSKGIEQEKQNIK